VLSLAAAAFGLWRQFHDEIEAKLRPGGAYASVPDWGAKSAEQAARLACLFHLWDHGQEGEIGAECMAGAVRVARWFLSEAVWFVARTGASEPEEWRDARALDHWLDGRAPIGLAEVLRYGPGRIRKADRRDAALGVLQDLHRVRLVGGRAERSPFIPPPGGSATAIPAVRATPGQQNSRNSKNSSSRAVHPEIPDEEIAEREAIEGEDAA